MSTTSPTEQYVVLADVVGSREIEDRSAFRDSLTSALERANADHRSAIAAPFEIIKGLDEFGGVLAELAPAYELLDGILNELHPVAVRVAIASGGIDVGRLEDGVAALDGPAFHRADRVLEEITEADLYAGVDTGEPADRLVTSALDLLLIARERRTDRQIEVIQAYERRGTQVAAAEELGIPQQAVSQALRRADYYRTRAIREQLMEGISSIYG